MTGRCSRAAATPSTSSDSPTHIAMCRYKYVLGANDRKMQKGGSHTVNKVLVAPRDHFLDNAGMSESDTDQEAVEEGMLTEAPVTPEKSLAAHDIGSPSDHIFGKAAGLADGSNDGSGEANKVAGDSQEVPQQAEGVAEGSEQSSRKAHQSAEADAGANLTVPSTPQVLQTHTSVLSACTMLCIGIK